jgi:oligopeptide/dipeptide ABC transporter ATP-binding protein
MFGNMGNANNYLLTVENLKTYYPIKKGLLRRTVGYIRAVDGVSFAIRRGQTLGLVGESGCGKTTVARTIARLTPATVGRVIFNQVDVLSAGRNKLRQLRKDISLIFQDPFGSLNPRMTVGSIIGEPLKVHRLAGHRWDGELTERVAALLSKVGLTRDHINRYPHEFSAGQRQRIGIARALALGPKLVICDEPVGSLDISIQAQILNLLKDLQQESGLTYLFIAHDLAVVDFFCDVVAVMYMGRIVEQASAEKLCRDPLHPYTRALMSAIPQIDPSLRRQRPSFGDETIRALIPPLGCTFGPRCSLAGPDCREQMPPLVEKSDSRGHFIACWRDPASREHKCK